MTSPEVRGITLTPTDAGVFRVGYDEVLGTEYDWAAVRALPRQMKDIAGDDAAVRFGICSWAGPHDVYLAVLAGMTSTGVLLGGAAAFFSTFVKQHPERPITIVFNDQSSFTITGDPIPDDIARRIDELAAENGKGAPAELEVPPESATGNGRVQPEEFDEL